MACFTRFFHTRQKNSFTPDKDENKDTVLNTSESTVVSMKQDVQYITEKGFSTQKTYAL